LVQRLRICRLEASYTAFIPLTGPPFSPFARRRWRWENPGRRRVDVEGQTDRTVGFNCEHFPYETQTGTSLSGIFYKQTSRIKRRRRHSSTVKKRS
jgi:hypothetical protein